MMLTVHSFLVGGDLWIFELNVICDVIRLSSKEVLFELFGVDDGWEVSLHLSFTFDQFVEMLMKLNGAKFFYP